ncbi:acyltransferase family protein [Bacillus daqingensis]|uniref:Acyltransferase family protein n=1 Tax=Bacillus daqingensis TaxID=872396 RepID=A0ABV9NXB8_9BACI
MNNKKVIDEVFWIRAVSCLAVVMVHAVYKGLEQNGPHVSQVEEYILIAVRFAAFFGTPAFIFISELLLAYAYPRGLPRGFFRKRVIFLLAPFISISVLYAIAAASTWQEAGRNALLNVFAGNFTTYFILVIFQFYILHMLFHRLLARCNPWLMLTIALMMTVSYLGYFNLTEPPPGDVWAYIWNRGHWLGIPGWVFYFVLGYYAGASYDVIKQRLRKMKPWVIVFPLGSLLLVFLLVRFEIIDTVSSKRIDNIAYTVGMIVLLAWIAQRVTRVPAFILTISAYSFQIYLLHRFILLWLPHMEALPIIVYTLLAAVLAVLGSMLITFLLGFVPGSYYIIGKKLPVPYRSRPIERK